MRWRNETRLAAEHLGYEVVETDGVTDWQGWGVHLLRKDGSWAVLAWSYGSCGGCDRYEDEIMGDPEHCAKVFGDLLEACASEEEARSRFSERKGW